MKRNTVAFGAIVIAIASLAVGRICLAAAGDKGVKALVAADNAWSDAAVAKNVDGVASFYAEDGIAYPPNEPIAVGQTAARKVWASYFADPSFEISWKPASAGVVKNAGWTAGTYKDSFKGQDGKTVVETGKYLTVWRKGADGKWKAIHDMWNTDSK